MPIKRARRVKRSSKKTKTGKKAITWSAIRKANKKRKASSLELLVYSWLDEDKIIYKKEKAIGRCHVDIFIEPDIVCELNGCYFHGCSECFPKPSKRQLVALAKDIRRYAFFQYKKCMKVIVIKECEVLNNPDDVRRLLRSLPRK